MRIVALDNYDNIQEGTVYDAPDGQAARLISKGLAKAAPVPNNKMAPASDNKANPSGAGGRGQPSSASPAAQASPQTTAQPYPGGGLVKPDPAVAAAEEAAVAQQPRRRGRAPGSKNKAKTAE